MTVPADQSDPTASDPLSAETRARQREALAAHRRRPDRRNQGLVIVHTGDGKGKTTAALGLLLRAWGQGLRVAMFQFIKAKSGNWGESRAARKMGVEIVPLGSGFTWTSTDLERDRALAHEDGTAAGPPSRAATPNLFPYDAGIKAQKGIEF